MAVEEGQEETVGEIAKEQMQQPFGVGVGVAVAVVIVVAAEALKFVLVKAAAESLVFLAYPSHPVHQLVPL